MKLALVVPCYNEEEVLEDTTKQLCELFDQLHKKGKKLMRKVIYYL